MNQKKQQELARQRNTQQAKNAPGSENRLKSLVFKPKNSMHMKSNKFVGEHGDPSADQVDPSNTQ
jgi:hypothetical protein